MGSPTQASSLGAVVTLAMLPLGVFKDDTARVCVTINKYVCVLGESNQI